MKNLLTKCGHCGSKELYTRQVSSGPALLRGLRNSLSFQRFDIVVCADCGYCELFVEPEARRRVRSAKGWRPVAQTAGDKRQKGV